jgi:hypothetical protein
LVKRNEVDQRFIERWADRFIEIAQKHGQAAAVAWLGAFINPKDSAVVVAEVNKKVVGGTK